MAKEKKDKKPTPQTDVRIVGGQTTVTLRAYGNESIARFGGLVGELVQNATTAKVIHEKAVAAKAALAELCAALLATEPTAEQKSPAAPAGSRGAA